MSLWQTNLPLSTLPINITCFSDGHIGFSYNYQFSPLVDAWGDGKQTVIDMQGILVDDVQLKYNVKYNYKAMQTVLAWLQSLKMEIPKFQ